MYLLTHLAKLADQEFHQEFKRLNSNKQILARMYVFWHARIDCSKGYKLRDTMYTIRPLELLE